MILGVFFEPVPMVMVSGRSHFCLRSCLLFSRRGPRHGVVSPVSQTKWDWNLVLLNELFRLVLLSRESVHWLAHDPLFSRWGLRYKVVSAMSQTKSDWNLVLFDELFHLVLVSKESDHWLACNLLFSRHHPQTRGGLTCLSDKVRLEPSAD